MRKSKNVDFVIPELDRGVTRTVTRSVPFTVAGNTFFRWRLGSVSETNVGLNGFAEEKPCIAKRSDREYPLRGLAQICRLDAPSNRSPPPMNLQCIDL
jgi:hypothetical protein